MVALAASLAFILGMGVGFTLCIVVLQREFRLLRNVMRDRR